MLRGKRVVVVMPAYNAEKTLEQTVEALDRSVVDDIIMVDVGLSNDRFIENLITKIRERKHFESIPFVAVDPL